MNKKAIKTGLSEFNPIHVEKYCDYLYKLSTQKKQGGEVVNPWASKIPDDVYIKYFKQVSDAGLVLDGKHVTITNLGVTFDFVAYKNKMLIAYPETKLSLGVVYKGDDWYFSENSGIVSYTHTHNDPFNKSDENVIGVYCVIRNRRGEFLTTLDSKEIKKHRAIAKTDGMWKKWFIEMCKKTVIKKACKYHFEDAIQEMEELDNTQTDVEQPVNVDITLKGLVEACQTMEQLTQLYKEKSPKGSDIKLFTSKKLEISNGNS